jgi:hypothetical protein
MLGVALRRDGIITTHSALARFNESRKGIDSGFLFSWLMIFSQLRRAKKAASATFKARESCCKHIKRLKSI